MKTCSILVALLSVGFSFIAYSQANRLPLDENGNTFQVVERGSNYRIHEHIERRVGPSGAVQEVKHSYTELAAGLCYRDSQTGKWIDSDPEIIVDANGNGLTQHSQHSIKFQPNINTAGAIDLTTPAGKRMRSHVLAIYLHDWKANQSVQIAGLQNSIGGIVGKDQVVYQNALVGNETSADVRYTLRKSGMSQDIIFQKLITPANWRTNEADIEIEIWTEFLEFPQPKKHSRAGKIAGFVDDLVLDFGDMRIGQGTAFSVGEKNERLRGTPVKKEWVTIEGRTFLIESVSYKSVRAELDSNPPQATLKSSSNVERLAFIHGRVPPSPLKPKTAEKKAMQVASSAFAEKGFVVDYETKFGSATDFTFRGDTTYYISDAFFLSGQTTIEGGTVIKSSVSGGEGLAIDWDGSIVCKTVPYRPAVFTSKNDNSVGEFISGSTGAPASSDVLIALSIGIEYPDMSLNNLRVSYAGTAFQFGTSEPGTGRLTDIQINDCGTAFTLGGSVYFGNILAHEVWTVFDVTYPDSEVLVEHLTVANDAADCVLHTGEIGSNGSFFIRNSVFAEIYDLGTSVGGSDNGFYHSPTFGSPYWSATSSPFQSVGGGHCYLAIDVYGSDASGFRNLGTTTIDSELLDSLENKTTYAPTEITANITSDAEWSPQVARDSDSPDLGYHYDPIDYAVDAIAVDAHLTVTAGTVVASYGSDAGLLVDGGFLTAFGVANNPVQMIRYNCVQEESGVSWAAANWYDLPQTVGIPYNSWGQTVFEFTEWSVMAGNNLHLWDSSGYASHSLRHCQFANGTIQFDNASAEVWNCLFERSHLNLTEESPSAFSVYNNTFIGGGFSIVIDSTDAEIHDNLFDRTAISAQYFSAQINHSHNGYVQGNDRILSPATGDVDLTSTGYQTGPYGGRFYYPSSGGSGTLHDLVNSGSRSATDAGLDTDYTVLLNQAPDENDVDIGFHYPSLQAPVAYGGDAPPVCAYPDNVPIILYGWDPQSFPLTFIKVTNPNHGTLGTMVQGDGMATVVYSPDSGFCGYDSFTFKVNNGFTDSDYATVNVTVGDPNPIANCQDVMTEKNTPINIILSGSDSCNDDLTFTVSGSGPSPGSLGMVTQIDANHASVTYTPGSSTFEGTDGFDFMVSNCGFSSQPGHVTVNVVSAPVLTADCREDRIFISWTIPEWMRLAGLADTFQIYRCNISSGSCTPITEYDTVDGSGSAFLDTDVVANMNYCYRVTFEHQDRCDGVTVYESPFSNVACSSICPAPPNTNCVIRSGFDETELEPNDDNQGVTTLLAALPISINFYGTVYTNLYVNNNGNVTFDSAFGGSGSYTPETLVQLGRDIIAPFWADIDTRVPESGAASDVVRYGAGAVGGRDAFGVNWVDVGYFSQHADKLVSVQLVLIDRSDIASGDFDMEFNYCKVEWEAGDVSGGCEGFWTGFDCDRNFYGGNPARAGFASANGSSFEFTGSGSAGAFLDSNVSTGLIYHSFNSTASGRYLFQFRSGIPLQTP